MNENSILAAFQTGWLSVEAFGLLRRYALHGKAASPEAVDDKRRFSFTERDPTLTRRLLDALQMLKATASKLLPELPPPVPLNLSDLLEEAKEDINPCWQRFEEWSSRAWNALLVSSPLAGQAFACGGDLADTYWYAQRAGAEKLAEMLRSYRLRYIAERLNDFSAHLPKRAVQAIQHSLERWSIGERVAGMDFDRQKGLLQRLESQAKVWHDLLLGLRQADSYLTLPDRRWATWGALAGTTGLVILVSLVVWLAVLALAGLGRGLMGYALNLPVDTEKLNQDLLTQLINWQNWSALLATLSSVIAVLTGLVKGVSGWLWAFQQSTRETLLLRRINHRTYRSKRILGKKENKYDQD